MENNSVNGPLFDLELEVSKLLTSPEMQKSLSIPGKKEKLLQYLVDDNTERLDAADQNDMKVAHLMFNLVTTYALLVGYERFGEDPAVARYLEILNKMYQGQDLQEEMAEVVEKLPEGFKTTVSGASQFAQDYLYKRLQEA